MVYVFFFFFFFKQKTAYEMSIGDWSSDVCSSDLRESAGDGAHPTPVTSAHRARSAPRSAVRVVATAAAARPADVDRTPNAPARAKPLRHRHHRPTRAPAGTRPRLPDRPDSRRHLQRPRPA